MIIRSVDLIKKYVFQTPLANVFSPSFPLQTTVPPLENLQDYHQTDDIQGIKFMIILALPVVIWTLSLKKSHVTISVVLNVFFCNGLFRESNF